MLIDILYIVFAYLLGSFPYMPLLSRAMGKDLSHERDYHIAMYRKVGRLAGISGIVVDFLKGILTVLAGYFLNLPLLTVCAGTVLVVFGQMWPVFRRFNGEKGNTTGIGATGTLLTLYGAGWVLVVGISIIFIGAMMRIIPRFLATAGWHQRLSFGGPPSNSLPIGMFLGFLAMPVASYLMHKEPPITIALALIFIGIVVRRLTANLRQDISEGKSSVGRILINRLFLDRSYY